MIKVLVTGATGFVGNHVIKELLKDGYHVIATSSDRSKAEKMQWLAQVEYIPFDLKNLDASINYVQFFKNPDVAIHLAWEGLPNYKSPFHIEENLSRHKTFLENLIENGLNDLTVTGTCLEYGKQQGSLRENMEVMPSTSYAIAKNELRISLQELQKNILFL